MAKTNAVTNKNITTTSIVTLEKLGKVQGWTVEADTACSPIGTLVRFTAKTVVISNPAIKQGKSKLVVKLGENNATAIIGQIAVIEKEAKAAVKAAAKPANNDSIVVNDLKAAGIIEDKPAKPAQKGKTPNKGNKTMTPAEKKKAAAAKAAADKKAAAEKAAAEKKAAADKKAAEKAAADAAKPVPVMPANPAGEKTPAYDEIKAAAEKDEKLASARFEMWKTVGEKYGYSVVPLTRQLMIEGLWPKGQDAQGNPATVEVDNGDGTFTTEFKPAGYQKIYKEEREKGTKGIGHFVNTAAASFGRVNMALGKAAADEKKKLEDEQNKKADGDKETDTLTTKQVNKMLIDIEKIANKLPAADLKTWLETSRSIAPILEEIKAENEELDALADI